MEVHSLSPAAEGTYDRQGRYFSDPGSTSLDRDVDVSLGPSFSRRNCADAIEKNFAPFTIRLSRRERRIRGAYVETYVGEDTAGEGHLD